MVEIHETRQLFLTCFVCISLRVSNDMMMIVCLSQQFLIVEPLPLDMHSILHWRNRHMRMLLKLGVMVPRTMPHQPMVPPWVPRVAHQRRRHHRHLEPCMRWLSHQWHRHCAQLCMIVDAAIGTRLRHRRRLRVQAL